MPKRRNKKIDDLSGEPIPVPPAVYRQTLRFLKLARKAAGQWDKEAADFYSIVNRLVVDFEHANKEFAQR